MSLSDIGVGREVSTKTLLDAIISSFTRWQNKWREEGFNAVLSAWESRAHTRGEVMEVRSGGVRVRGVYSGLDAHGHLLLDTSRGRHVISSGDVWLTENLR